MKPEISGEIAQIAEFTLQRGETLWAHKGALVAYDLGIDWQLKVPGGLGGAVRRSVSGSGFALTHISARRDNQSLTLAPDAPGHLAVWDLANGPVLTTRGAFIAAWGEQIDISVSVARRAGAALFGGAGLFLQKVSGRGMVLIHGSGDFIKRELIAGETVRVSTGNLAAFSDGVDYDIETVGSVRKTLFGGEGLFVTRLRGPGTLYLQSLKRSFGRS